MGQRPIVAIVSNALTPYRLAFHRRIVREIPQIELWSLFTHGEGDSRWSQEPPAEINPVQFGVGEAAVGLRGPRRPLHEWRKGGRMIDWLRRTGAAAVVVLGYNDPGRLRLIRWCYKHRMPVLLFGDSNIRDDDARGGGWRRWMKKRIIPRVLAWCDGILACGSLGVAYFQRYGVPRDRIFLCPYEPDYSQIDGVGPPQTDDAQRKFNLRSDRRRIVYSGRLVAQKRVDLLINAFAAIAASRPEWDLLIVGAGPLETELRNQVPAPLSHRIRWLGFVDDPSALAAVYKNCDILALPSEIEPWAVVINEAVAAGLAVIASDAVGAAAELVRDNINGHIFKSGDLVALIGALRDATDAAQCRRFRASSAGVLAQWRRIADPVGGLRQALRHAGLRLKMESGAASQDAERSDVSN